MSSLQISLVSALFVLHSFIPTSRGKNLIQPVHFEEKMRTLLTEGLGVSDMQDSYNKLGVISERIDGSAIIPELSAAISIKIKDRIAAARRLKDAIETSYKRPATVTSRTQCCNLETSSLKYDPRFRAKPADVNNVCTLISGRSTSGARNLEENVVETMKENLNRSPNLKWQYFGSDEGLTTQFPATNTSSDCSSYDNRFRPWYVETATPVPKHVVIVLDISGSMKETMKGSGGKSRMVVAQEAAATVLGTMNPRDKVGLVAFNHEINPHNHKESSCYDQRLAEATPTNIENLKEALSTLRSSGGTHYSPALRKAFAMLKESEPLSNTTTRQVILFLTDGDPIDENEVMNAISVGKANLKNKVVIMTFGFGANPPILARMAKHNEGARGEGDYGRNIFVQDASRLRSEMASYYDFFSRSSRESETVISVPYLDVWGLGMVITVLMPCYHNNKFIGVAAVDITMSDLLADVTYFSESQASYAFLVDRTDGRTMMHPLLPAPSSVTEAPVYLDIRNLESEPKFAEVFSFIKKGEMGNMEFPSKRYLPRGGSSKEGIRVVVLNSTYYWRPVQGTKFSLGLVIAVGDQRETLSREMPPKGFNFTYHRLDLNRPGNPCLYLNRFTVTDQSVVKFVEDAFKDPYQYLGFDETEEVVNSYKSYFSDRADSSPNPGFKEGIRNSVVATAKADEIWLRDRTQLTDYLVWRYVATSDGIMRMIPGTSFPKTFDPRKRPWYREAISNIGSMVLTTPYLDIAGAGYIVTMAHTIHVKQQESKTADDVVAVMGADFPLTYFSKLLIDTYPLCKSNNYACFVMNQAGFLVLHDDFIHPTNTRPLHDLVHITEKEKRVAEDLIRKRYLKKKSCRNLEKIRRDVFWELDVPAEGVSTLSSNMECQRYQITPVGNSNVYLGIIDERRGCRSQQCVCAHDGECHNLTCECPCFSKLEFEYCESKYPPSSIPLCPVAAAPLVADLNKDPSTKGLPKCFNVNCGEKNSYEQCYGVVSCSWCVRDRYEKALGKPYCTDYSRCIGGKEVPIPQENEGEEQEEGVPIVVIGTISGLLCFILAVVTIVYYYKWKRKKPLKVDHSSSVVFTNRNVQTDSNSGKKPPGTRRSNRPLELIFPIYESMGPPSILGKLPEPPKIIAQYEDMSKGTTTSSTPDYEDCSTAQVSSNTADKLTRTAVSPQKDTFCSPSKENGYENSTVDQTDSKASTTNANHIKCPVYIEVI